MRAEHIECDIVREMWHTWREAARAVSTLQHYDSVQDAINGGAGWVIPPIVALRGDDLDATITDWAADDPLGLLSDQASRSCQFSDGGTLTKATIALPHPIGGPEVRIIVTPGEAVMQCRWPPSGWCEKDELGPIAIEAFPAYADGALARRLAELILGSGEGQ